MASVTQLRRAVPAPARGAGAARPSALASNDALRLDGVTRAFGALRAVDDVSLSVAAGQKYAILGSNGAGKTTLFNAITGDFPPTTGRIYFFGEDITELPPHERIRKGLRRTYQSSLLFRELSVRDNLFLAVRGVSNGRFAFLRARASHASTVATQDLLERARLSHLADELVATLAHGQQRQLEIGMALDLVRRACRRPVAGRAPRAGGAAALAARAHELRADRARPGHRAQRHRAGHGDAQRTCAEDRHAIGNRERRASPGHLYGEQTLMVPLSSLRSRPPKGALHRLRAAGRR
jgi:branched-chain amino acid transport system ATP-binding protein